MTPKVVILGNGFDLNLGLKTSYKDFLKSSEFKKIWKTHTNFIADRLINNYNLVNWIDIENELRKIAIEYNNSDPSYLRILRQCYMDITEALAEYLKRVVKKKDNLEENTPAAKFLRVMSKYPDDFTVFSFNYTSLRGISHTLHFNGCPHCFHVHGTLNNNNIIMGFQDDVANVDKFSYMIKTFNPHYSSLHIRKALDNAKEIIIFGHSLGSTDYHYFSRLFNRLSDPGNPDSVRLSIITATDSSRIDILNNLREMNNNRTNYLFDQNEVTIYTACVYWSQFHLHSLFKRLEVESQFNQTVKKLQHNFN